MFGVEWAGTACVRTLCLGGKIGEPGDNLIECWATRRDGISTE
jgi:hypothetical protein